jgi:hypothetical protein
MADPAPTYTPAHADRLRHLADPEGVRILSRESHEAIGAALGQIERLRAEVDTLRDLANRATNDAENAADAVDTLRQIGEVIGCDHADGADDRARLVRCVRETVEGLRDEIARLRLRPDRRARTHWPDCWRAEGHHGCAVARAEQIQAEVDRLTPRWTDRAPTEPGPYWYRPPEKKQGFAVQVFWSLWQGEATLLVDDLDGDKPKAVTETPGRWSGPILPPAEAGEGRVD